MAPAITVDVRGLEPPVCRFPLVILQQARPGAGLGAEVFLTTGEARKAIHRKEWLVFRFLQSFKKTTGDGEG